MNLRWRIAFLGLLLSTASSAHLIVDVRMSITAPDFVAAQQNFTYRVIADDLANDNAYGIVVTTVLPPSVKFSSAKSGTAWRCSESKLTVTCSAEQIPPGPNPIDISVVAPTTTGRLTASTNVQSLGSFDPNPKNNDASLAVVVYDPASCRADAPLLNVPVDESPQPAVVALSWSAVPGAQSYTIYTSVEGALAAPVLTTDRTEASLIAEPGRTDWWVQASFGNCPPVVSAKRHFTASTTVPRIVGDYSGRPDLDVTRDGSRADASFRTPFGVALSPDNNTLYISDETDHVVRKVTATDVVTITGTIGSAGSTDGEFAQFHNPRGLAVTPVDGFIYAADAANHEIRVLYTGGPFVPAFDAGGAPQASGYVDDIGNNARFNTPSGITATERGSLYVADTQNQVIRKMTPYPATVGVFTISTVAGVAGQPGSSDGGGAVARFRAPLGVAVDSSGGAVYVADTDNHTIRQIVNSVVSTLAGEAGVAGSSDGRGTTAHFNHPTGIAVDARGNVYVSDRGNGTVRRVAPSGLVTTIAAGFNAPAGIAIDASGVIYVADSGNHMIRVIQTPTAPPPPAARHRAATH